MTTITLHGELEDIGKTWKYAAKSVSECLHAIHILSGRNLYKKIIELDKKGLKFKVIVNGETFSDADKLDINNLETIRNSELAINRGNLRNVDIVPIIEGGDSDIGQIILGSLLIIVGVLMIVGTLGGGTILGVGFILAGIGLAVGGIINLLTSAPSFEQFSEIKGGQKSSYLFSGPTQTVREGQNVPVIYGRIICGSYVISASYETSEKNADDSALTV